MRNSRGRLSDGGKELEYKVVVLGEKSCGKTSLVTRYIYGCFSPVQQSTIGAFFLTKRIVLANGSTFKLQLWDTAGQERFRSMAKMYYRGAVAIIVCFDITDLSSWDKLKDWILEVQSNTSDFITVISCNKCDLEDSRAVKQALIASYAAEVNAVVFQTSAKNDSGICELFSFVCDRIYETRIKGTSVEETDKALRTLDNLDPGPPKRGPTGCC